MEELAIYCSLIEDMTSRNRLQDDKLLAVYCVELIKNFHISHNSIAIDY